MKFEPHEIQNLLNFSENLIDLAEQYSKEVHGHDRHVFIDRRGDLISEYHIDCHFNPDPYQEKIDIKSFQEWLELKNIDITEH